MKSIILAGGSGSRLWPLSRDMYPKQLLSLDTDESLLQQTFMRLNSFCEANDIVTITNIKHLSDIKLQLNKIDNSNIAIGEPLGKNTAPAIACTLEYFKQHANKDDVVLIVPSDHLIKNIDAFNKTVEQGKILAEQGYIVTFGIKPTYPETGYGYIKTEKELTTGHKVERFVEKPNLETAKEYLESGNYYWNGGIFIFNLDIKFATLEQINEAVGEIRKSKVPGFFRKMFKLDTWVSNKITRNKLAHMKKSPFDEDVAVYYDNFFVTEEEMKG